MLELRFGICDMGFQVAGTGLFGKTSEFAEKRQLAIHMEATSRARAEA
jgi:selenophosphate synthase